MRVWLVPGEMDVDILIGCPCANGITRAGTRHARCIFIGCQQRDGSSEGAEEI